MNVLDDLRAIVPQRRLTGREAYVLAERQATLLLKLRDIDSPPVPEHAVSELPFLLVRERFGMRSSGATKWMKPRWVVLLNADEPIARKRFSLAHEFKHIVDHPYCDRTYGDRSDPRVRRYIETVCDQFAACLLMPRPWVKGAYGRGVQSVPTLAELFEVSERAMAIRLQTLGLTEPVSRCDEASEYRRAFSTIERVLQSVA